MTANRSNQSLNNLLTIPRRRRTHHPRGLNLLMTTSMSSLVQVRVRTVRRLLMSHPLPPQRSQRKTNQIIKILMVPVTSLLQSRNDLCNILQIPAAERSTSHLEAQLVRVHLILLPNRNNLHNKQRSQSLKIHHHHRAV